MRLASTIVTALAMTLSGCEGGGDPVQQALRDVSAENHAATVQEGVVSAPAHAGTSQAATAGDQAFAASEAGMRAGMAAASGATVDQVYVAKMIAHHEGALAMAAVALAESRDPEIRRMAEAVKATRTREIAEMRAWKPTAQPTP